MDFVPVYRIIITPKPQGPEGKKLLREKKKDFNEAGRITVLAELCVFNNIFKESCKIF